MTTLEKLDKIRDKHPGSMDITIYCDGKARIWFQNGVRPFYALTLEEAVNRAYEAAFPKITAKPGDLVEIARYDDYKYVIAVANEDGTFSDYHRVLCGNDLESMRFNGTAWKVRRILVQGPLPEPIPVESAE